MKTTKSRYKFQLRPLTGDGLDGFELEAGPFTPLEASAFGQTEAAKRTMGDSQIWVCDYSAIVDPLPHRPLPLQGLLLIVGCITLGYLIGWFLVTVGS